ncbi:MAG: hypothetical protein JXR84_01700 [Anaerolineae bacterium]|nr:hypothetical protein [Anaerolineae bacterium]
MIRLMRPHFSPGYVQHFAAPKWAVWVEDRRYGDPSKFVLELVRSA